LGGGDAEESHFGGECDSEEEAGAGSEGGGEADEDTVDEDVDGDGDDEAAGARLFLVGKELADGEHGGEPGDHADGGIDELVGCGEQFG
jgi:hypothetical protein